jgi:hypothetical protein
VEKRQQRGSQSHIEELKSNKSKKGEVTIEIDTVALFFGVD